MSPTKKPSIVDQVKIWITPGLVSIIGFFFLTILNELRSDVKTLIQQNARTETQIQSQAKEIEILKSQMWEIRGLNKSSSKNMITTHVDLVATKPEIPDFTVRKEPAKITTL